MTDPANSHERRRNGAGHPSRARSSTNSATASSPRYTIDDLTAETGINGRTIRYYISEGLLTRARGRGPSATYDEDHLLRLRLIKELKDNFKPLEAIKQELAGLSTEDLEAHFAIRSGPSEGRWRRIIFTPDLELHVRERDPRDYRFERAVDQIVQLAGVVLSSHREPE